MSSYPIADPKPLPTALKSVSDALVKNGKWALLATPLLVGVIAFADYATGYEVRLAILYLLPVFLATWNAGRIAGMLIAVLATLSWLISFQSSHVYSHDIYYYGEGAILLGTLIAFALILGRLRQALEHADQRFVTVLEGLDAAVYVNDMTTGRILYTNRRFREFLSVGSIGSAGEIERQFDVAPADFFAKTAIATRDSAPLRGEFQDKASKRWFLVHARVINWIDGRSVSLKVVADITQNKQAEEISRQQLEKLQMSARLITIGEMASSLAHELNQPLTAIASYNQGCVRLLRSGDADIGELLGFMEKCGAQAVRAGNIINRMREFVRKREPIRSPHDLNAIINEAAHLVELEAENNGVALSVALAPALPAALADAIMIEQVLLNLIKNAIEAMQAPGHQPRTLLITSGRGAEGMLQVSLRDSGHGIAAEVAANLYTPFFSTKQSGMGIGLNISRSIIELHGGKLWHECGIDGGSVFHFTVPVAFA